MTTQALPSFDTALADQVQHTKNVEAKARDWQRVADAQRAQIDQLYKEALANVRLIGTLAGERDAALISAHEIIAKLEATIAALERRLAEAQQGPAAEGG